MCVCVCAHVCVRVCVCMGVCRCVHAQGVGGEGELEERQTTCTPHTTEKQLALYKVCIGVE